MLTGRVDIEHDKSNVNQTREAKNVFVRATTRWMVSLVAVGAVLQPENVNDMYVADGELTGGR